MGVLALAATFLLLSRSVRSCDELGFAHNVGTFEPWQETYATGDKATMTCLPSYIISWATTSTEGDAVVECGSSDWIPEGQIDFAGTVGCVECIAGTVDCSGGTCTDGVCVCPTGTKQSLDDPRLCETLQCPELTLSNQIADPAAGPYDVGEQVTVTCDVGFHVEGTESDVKQLLDCNSDGVFDQTLKPCVVCAENDDCTLGTCNSNKLCECDEAAGFILKDDDKSVCEKVTCPDNYCSNNGKCSVKGVVLECDCKPGTGGEKCDDFTVFPCDSNPCKNSGTCERVMGPDDYTKHSCTCTDAFEGDSCEFAKNFYVGDDGIARSGTSLTSVEFSVVPAKGADPMYIALLKVSDTDGGVYKVLLLKTDDGTISLHVIDEDLADIHQAEIDGLDFKTTVTIKISIDVGNENKLTLNAGGVVKATDLVANDISDLVIGGIGCAWNQEDCSFGKSRIFYHAFVGYFGTVTIEGEREMFESLTGATASVLDCSTFSCANNGQCDDTSGQISCTCPTGFAGFDCGTYTDGVSFNGYTSDITFSATTVPILDGDQTVHIAFNKDAAEIGEMVSLTIGGCAVVLKTAGGDQYKVGDEDKEVTVADDKIVIVLDGTNVMIAGETMMSCALDTDVLSADAGARLGGMDPVDGSDVTLKNSRYQGCISKISVNGIDIMRLHGDNVENDVDTQQCITTWDPPSPCEASVDPCKNDQSCKVMDDDNTASCECLEPYVGSDTCDRKAYCDEGHECGKEGKCVELSTKEDCNEAQEFNDELECGTRWYYYCNCTDGWRGLNCGDKIVKPTDSPVVDDGNDTTTIIVVIVVVAVVLGVVVTVIIVKKRRSGSGNGTTNGKTEGTYSPQAQEKDLEMSGKVDEAEENPKNLYEDIDVIKNPNAESAPEEKEALPPPPPETVVTVEPSAPEIYPTLEAPADEPPVAETPAPVVEPADVVVEPAAPDSSPTDQV